MKCEFCGVPPSVDVQLMKCGGCKIVFYCNQEHQRKDWVNGHKAKCKCYEVLNFIHKIAEKKKPKKFSLFQ